MDSVVTCFMIEGLRLSEFRREVVTVISSNFCVLKASQN